MPTLIRISNQSFRPTGVPGSVAITVPYGVDLASVQSDHNAFYQKADEALVRIVGATPEQDQYLTLAQWQALGKDLNSATFDPEDPEIAASLAEYESRLCLQPPIISNPCCARFLFCLDHVSGDPCFDQTSPIFSQHLASGIGPMGWSDKITYDEPQLKMESWTFCGPCNMEGLLAEYPTVHP